MPKKGLRIMKRQYFIAQEALTVCMLDERYLWLGRA